MLKVFTLTGALLIILYASPLVVVVLCVVAYGYYSLQKFYRHSSRDMRRLEATYSSPVGTLLMDCLANAPVIRAQQLQSAFDMEFSKALDKVKQQFVFFESLLIDISPQAQQVSLAGSIASQWLTLRLQLLGLVVIVSIAILAVLNAAYDILPMSGSKLGLSLSYAFALVGYVNGLVDSVSRAEQELISVERVGEYISLPDEYSDDNEREKRQESAESGTTMSFSKRVRMSDRDGGSNKEWPHNGMIELFDVSFSYNLEHDEYKQLTGKNIVAGGRHRGMVGRRNDHDGDEAVTVGGADKVSFALSHISVTFCAGSRTVIIGRTGKY